MAETREPWTAPQALAAAAVAVLAALLVYLLARRLGRGRLDGFANAPSAADVAAAHKLFSGAEAPSHSSFKVAMGPEFGNAVAYQNLRNAHAAGPLPLSPENVAAALVA